MPKNRWMTENLFNMLGEPIHTYNIDSGHRWQITDTAQKPILQWDNQHRQTSSEYDTLQRPIFASLRLGVSQYKVEKTIYGTSSSNNTKGQITEQYDQSGKTTISSYDFKGNTLSLAKQMATNYKNIRICKSIPHPTSILWDYKDNLKEVTLNASGDKAYYVYDAGGERVRKLSYKLTI